MPITIPAAVAGTVNVAVGAIIGNRTGIKIGDNSIQFTGGAFEQNGGPLGLGGSGAVALGNAQLYADDVSPDDKIKVMVSTQLALV